MNAQDFDWPNDGDWFLFFINDELVGLRNVIDVRSRGYDHFYSRNYFWSNDNTVTYLGSGITDEHSYCRDEVKAITAEEAEDVVAMFALMGVKDPRISNEQSQ